MSENLSDDKAGQYSLVARAIGFIHANAHEQPSLTEIAGAVHLSEYHLQRVFSEWAGISPKRFLQYLTKEYAKNALRESANVLSVALDSGLSSPGRLHDLMVSCEAMTPGEIKLLGRGSTVDFGYAPTPFGDALLGWTERGVCFLAFCDDARDTRYQELSAQWPAASFVRDDKGAAHLVERIFFATSPSGKLYLALKGTNFQLKVWEALLRIQPSQLVSYRQLATMAGYPNAQRAVGSALAANSIGYLIPCHRVIRETGDIGNYRWGKQRKLALVSWEAVRMRESSFV